MDNELFFWERACVLVASMVVSLTFAFGTMGSIRVFPDGMDPSLLYAGPSGLPISVGTGLKVHSVANIYMNHE